MQILFSISVFCFAGVLWAAFAIARKIKANRLRSSSDTPVEYDYRQHLLFTPEPALTFETGIRQTRQESLNQSVRDITIRKQWILPPRAIRTRRASLLPFRISEPRTHKSPQPARYGPMELLDRAYFNEDMGDLTDPYQPLPSRANDPRGNHRRSSNRARLSPFERY
jgi:hypothetical protein